VQKETWKWIFIMLTYANMNVKKIWQDYGARLWAESMIKYTTKVVMNSYSHIFTQMQEPNKKLSPD